MTRLATTKSGSEGNWDGPTVESSYDVRSSFSKQPHASRSILSESGLSMASAWSWV